MARKKGGSGGWAPGSITRLGVVTHAGSVTTWMMGRCPHSEVAEPPDAQPMTRASPKTTVSLANTLTGVGLRVESGRLSGPARVALPQACGPRRHGATRARSVAPANATSVLRVFGVHRLHWRV